VFEIGDAGHVFGFDFPVWLIAVRSTVEGMGPVKFKEGLVLKGVRLTAGDAMALAVFSDDDLVNEFLKHHAITDLAVAVACVDRRSFYDALKLGKDEHFTFVAFDLPGVPGQFRPDRLFPIDYVIGRASGA
jgi:hypothetical protein